MEIRLQKWLADAGAASRRKGEEMIMTGRVAVNGQIVSVPGAKADTEKDIVTLDGRPLNRATHFVYLILHKPEGVVTTLSDPQGRPAVSDYLPPTDVRLFPVGRLDYDTSGLLLLTNDGMLTQTLTHPRHGAAKQYAAKLQGIPSKAALQRFCSGLMIDGRRTAPCDIRIERIWPHHGTPHALATITLREGRNRQIRKMCEAIGHPVTLLKRVALGPVKLGDLPRGQWRYLTPQEIASLSKTTR